MEEVIYDTLDQAVANAIAPGAGPSVSVPSVDRRRAPRQERLVSAWLSDSAEGGVMREQQQVTVTNLSLNGVGFRASKLLERGNSHWIVIATEALHLSTRLRVISVRPREDGGCDVGGEFF